MERGVRRIELMVPADRAALRLDQLLREALPASLGRPLSNASIRRLIVGGAIQVAGRIQRRPAQVLRAGEPVVARIRLDLLADQRGPDGAVRVLYEDAWLIAFDKPAGLPMHAGADARRADFVSQVQAFLLARDGQSTALGVHQRLDLDTTGVALFVRDPAANAPLAAAFGRRNVTKTYEALTQSGPKPQPRLRLDQPLAPGGRGRAQRMQPDREGQAAVTELRLLSDLGRALHFEARPLTGRKHQIRAHLAAAGWPILGDERYGARRDARVPRVMLHARRLELTHPITGAPLCIESALPADFAELLAALRQR